MTRETFKKCFDLWFDELRGYITYRCCDGDLATDIVQEAFVKVWEKDMVYEGEKTKGLLYKMANNLWVSHYRKSQTEKKYRLSFTFKQPYNNTEEQLHFDELKERYELALANLSDKRKTVFLMSRMEDKTYPEIATELGISVKAVEKRMTLALQELRKILNHGR